MPALTGCSLLSAVGELSAPIPETGLASSASIIVDRLTFRFVGLTANPNRVQALRLRWVNRESESCTGFAPSLG